MKKRKNTKSSKSKIIENLFGSNYLPYILTFAAIGIMFVLIRMKGVEQQYKYNEIAQKIEKVTFDNKDLKARKARLLSVKNLRRFAKKYDLKEPSQKQIIVMP